MQYKETLSSPPHDSIKVTEDMWNSPVIDELDRIEKEQTCWDGFPDGLGSRVLYVTEKTINQNIFKQRTEGKADLLRHKSS